MKKKPTKIVRSRTTDKPERKFTAHLHRTWKELPPDALVSRGTIAEFAGVNVRTVQRHADRGLLPHDNMIAKSDVDKWLEGVRGTMKPGRPSRRRLAHARQRVLSY